MSIAWLGGVGIGLVWGWLMGRLISLARLTSLSWLALLAETFLVSGQIYLFADWSSLFIFLGAAGLALLIHLGWIRMLRARLSGAKCEGGPL
jgi:hypothetical protein